MFRVLCFLLASIFVTSLIVFGQKTGRDLNKEKVIWDELNTVAPKSVDTFKAATAALDAGNYDEAARLYESVRKQVPHSDSVLRRLGTSLCLAGKPEYGLEFLEEAARIKQSPENLISLGEFLAYPSENKEGTPEQKQRAFELMVIAERLGRDGDGSYQIELGRLALELGKDDVFRSVTATLVAKHPELMPTHYYNAIVAVTDEKWSLAEDEIKKAEALGLPHDAAQQFLDSGIHNRALGWRALKYALYLVGLWIVGLIVLFVFGKLMSVRTIRTIEQADPNVAASGSELTLRKAYRRLIAVAGVYYYFSFPFVIFLVLGTAATLVYGSLLVGRIPVKLVVIVTIGALVTVYKMIRSLFLKIEKEDPGRSLAVEEAPQLWELTRQVAHTVNTRAVDEIRVSPGTDLAVYESGSWRQKSRDEARRVLILGVGILNDFHLNPFRAVLAHEYGHFSHRDTAGGDIALRVNNDMIKFAHAMILSRQNVWWNVAFHFLRIYLFIFRRISHGATRLQEVLADRVAAAKYGAQAFEEGLTHVVRKSVEFRFITNHEINQSANARRALQNIYELPRPAKNDIDSQTEESLSRETTEDDTHPSPNDRFRLTRKVTSQSEPPIAGMVWDLFRDKAALTAEMTAAVQQQLNGGR